jgi:hypothetical protein
MTFFNINKKEGVIMSNQSIQRRDFLKVMGIGTAALGFSTIWRKIVCTGNRNRVLFDWVVSQQ